MSDAGAGFSLGESLVEWPMAATAVCKFAQALQWKSLVLCGKLSDPSFALQAKNQGRWNQQTYDQVTHRPHPHRVAFSRHFLLYLFPSTRRVNVTLDSSLALSVWLRPLQGPGGSRRGGKAAPRRAGSCGKCSSASGCTSAQGSLRESPRGAAFDRGGFFQVGLPRDMESHR